MSAKFEELVAALLKAKSEWDLARLPFRTMQDGVADLRDRLQALERHQAPPKPGDA